MIYCIGDSFTFGAELPDALDGINPSKFAWPSLLGNMYNIECINLGKQACSNARILKRTMDVTLAKRASVIIIAWSDPNRTDYLDNDGVFSVWPGRNTTRMETHRIDITKKLTAMHNDKTDNWHQRAWLRQVILLQNFLTTHNQKYIMVQSHMSQWTNWNYKEQNQDLTQYIDETYFPGWPYEGFTEWAYGTKEGPNGHFLEEGHNIIAHKLYAHIGRFGWFS